jgi:hypothetical protein
VASAFLRADPASDILGMVLGQHDPTHVNPLLRPAKQLVYAASAQHVI